MYIMFNKLHQIWFCSQISLNALPIINLRSLFIIFFSKFLPFKKLTTKICIGEPLIKFKIFNCIKFWNIITFHIKCSALILKISWPKASMIMTIKAKTLMAVLLWPKNARHPVQRVRSTCIVAMSTREHNSIDACTRKKNRFIFTFHILLKLSANGGTSNLVLKKVKMKFKKIVRF